MTLLECNYFQQPKVGQFAITDEGYIILLTRYVGSTDDISEKFRYKFISNYPYELMRSTDDITHFLNELMRSTISTSNITYFIKETDITIDNIKQAFPEYFI